VKKKRRDDDGDDEWRCEEPANRRRLKGSVDECKSFHDSIPGLVELLKRI
jgi:hypothetical protein